MDTRRKTNDPAANPDPITKTPGAHPVGTGIGAAAGGAAGVGGAIAAGAAMGTVVGPVGTAVGAAAGAVVGGLIGKAAAEEINPSVEHEYWRANYTSRPYVTAGSRYEDYGPAYQYGWEAYSRHGDKDFDDVETDLQSNWEKARGKSRLSWDQARQASRDAWQRVYAGEDEE
jgi:hypothetical protein